MERRIIAEGVGKLAGVEEDEYETFITKASNPQDVEEYLQRLERGGDDMDEELGDVEEDEGDDIEVVDSGDEVEEDEDEDEDMEDWLVRDE